MKFELNWSSKLCFNILMGLQNGPTLAESSKVNLHLWNLFIVIVSLDRTTSSDYNKITFQKIIFSKQFPLKCIRKQI